MGVTINKSCVRLLLGSKETKDDEFYTSYETVETIISEYKEDLVGKIVYCNCDHEWSNFVKYFQNNKDVIGYKEFYHTGLTDEFVFGDYNVGDFRNADSIELLKKCDVVITNPPFSLLIEWYKLVKQYDKKFIFLAPNTFLSRKEVRSDFYNKKIFINARSSRECDRNFKRPDGSLAEVKCYPHTNIKKIDYNYRDTTHKVFMKDCNYEYYDGTNILAIVDGERVPIDYNGLFTLSINQCWHFDFKKYNLICFTTDYEKKLLINGKEQFVRLLCEKNSNFEADAKVEKQDIQGSLL
jgi:hypothetical protein